MSFHVLPRHACDCTLADIELQISLLRILLHLAHLQRHVAVGARQQRGIVCVAAAGCSRFHLFLVFCFGHAGQGIASFPNMQPSVVRGSMKQLNKKGDSVSPWRTALGPH